MEKLIREDESERRTIFNTLSEDAFFKINTTLMIYFGLIKTAILTKIINWDRYVFEIMPEKDRLHSVTQYGKSAVELSNEEYFYMDLNNITEELDIGVDACRNAINEFAGLEILHIVKSGLPARNFYKVNYKIISKFLAGERDDLHRKCTADPSLRKSKNLQQRIQKVAAVKSRRNIDINYNLDKAKEESSLFSSKEENNTREASGVDFSFKTDWRKRTDSSLSKKKRALREKHISYENNSEVYEVLNKWESLGFPKVPLEHRSSVVKKIESLMAGNFFEEKLLENGDSKYLTHSFSKDEILSAIENRARGAFDIEYVPTDLKIKKSMQKLPLSVWLYNSNGGVSTFLKDLEKPYRKAPEKLKLVADEFPDYTEIIKEKFIEKILYGVEPINGWSIKDENNFRKASSRLCQLFESIDEKSRYIKKHQVEAQADLLIKALRDSHGSDEDDENVKIYTAHLCSDYTFNQVIPHYMGKQRMLKNDSSYF